MKKVDSAHVLKALRYQLLPRGLGKPDKYLLDGGPEFKDKLKEALRAWDAEAHVHAPLHHEAAGIAEIFNRTIKKKMSLLTYGPLRSPPRGDNRDDCVEIPLDDSEVAPSLLPLPWLRAAC